MKKYMVLYHAPIDAWKQTEGSSPEEMEKGMEAWMAWAKKCGDHLVDMGTPLAKGLKIGPGGVSEDSSRQVCGFSILQAESMEQARVLMKDHPHLDWTAECEIEIHESLPTPGG
ncbi:MAG: hypothetical protein GY790_18795 [Bacteroidetes bacterium]|nr:hypothetical protein [Bacteroidota bacterium]